MSLSKKERENLRYIIPGLLMFALVMFMFWQQFNAFTEARQAAAGERQALQQTRARLEELILLQQQSAELEKRLAVLEKQLPCTPGEENLILMLNDLSRRCGVQLNQVTFGSPIDHKEYIEMPFDVTFTGSFHHMLDLTGALQHTPRLLRINELVIYNDSAGSAEVITDISASTFYTGK